MKVGHNSIDETTLSEVIKAVEAFDEKIAEINEDKKIAYASAKAAGLEVSAVKALIAERRKERKDPEQFREHATLLELYRQVLHKARDGGLE